jgi:phage-related protein (TIGR01555 family)
MKFVGDFFKRFNKDSADTATTRKDHWFNLATNLGYKSRANLTKFSTNYDILSRDVLSSMYRSDGIVRKVVDIFVTESLRSFIETNDDLLEELKRLKLKNNLMDAAKDARLYGGSLLVAFVDDGRSLSDEIDYNNIERVVQFRSYDRYQITWDPVDIVSDYLDENFGEPLIYTIQPISGVAFQVHRSRVWRFRGNRISNLDKYRNLGWDDSVIQSIYVALRNLGNTMNSCAEIVQDFIIGVLHVQDFIGMISAQGYSEIEARLEDLRLKRSTANMIVVDAEHEKYEKVSSSVSGLPELWDRFSEVISATTDIPLTKLLGKSPSGLGATGRHEEVNWNNKVEEYRNDNIKPCVDWVMDLIKAQKSFNLTEDKFNWLFNPLSIPDPEEKAKVNLLCAQIDQIYIDRAGASAEFLFKKRYENGEFNPDIIVTTEDLKEQDDKMEIEAETLQIMQEEIATEKSKNNDSEELKAEEVLNRLIIETLSKFGDKRRNTERA